MQDVEVNLIITDYCMPGMTGYDLLRKIKVSSNLDLLLLLFNLISLYLISFNFYIILCSFKKIGQIMIKLCTMNLILTFLFRKQFEIVGSNIFFLLKDLIFLKYN